MPDVRSYCLDIDALRFICVFFLHLVGGMYPSVLFCEAASCGKLLTCAYFLRDGESGVCRAEEENRRQDASRPKNFSQSFFIYLEYRCIHVSLIN